MRRFIGLCCLNLILTVSHADGLQQRLNKLIDDTLPHANVGVLITDAATNQPIFSHDANKLLYPASNAKLFAAAAALYQLGANYQYETTLASDGKNIYLTFSGAPDLSTNHLKQLLLKLKTANLQPIPGNFVLDISRFSPPNYPAGTSMDDLGWYYAAPATAVILNNNSVSYNLIGSKELNAPIFLQPKNPNETLTIINHVVTVKREEAKHHCGLNIDILPQNTLNLFGCMAQKDKPVTMRFAIPNPQLYATQFIRKTLKEQGMTLGGEIIVGQTPKNAQILAVHHSKPLAALLKHMLEESDNLYADSITKALAFALTGQGTSKQGIYAMKQILTKYVPLDLKQLVIADGIGTRYNLSSPAQLVSLLTHLYQNKDLQRTFMATLPRMGFSGTLKDRMRNTPLTKNILAKTGTMHDISSLSGYLIIPGGKTYIFSIISNGIHGNLNQAKGLEEKILLTVYESLNQENLAKK